MNTVKLFDNNTHQRTQTVTKAPATLELLDNDGITHINLWINGKTRLGRMLAHFYESPFVHPYFGPFNSMEGFWHYIQNKERDDALRSLSNMAAKNYAKGMTWCHVEDFHKIIMAANYYKIEQNPELKKLFTESTLPFDYYYLHIATGDAEGQGGVVIRPSGYQWLAEGFEEIRTMMQFDERPEAIDYVKIFQSVKS